MIGQCDVITPHVILPFPESQHSAEDVPGVNPDAHVHVHARSFSDVSVILVERILSNILRAEYIACAQM